LSFLRRQESRIRQMRMLEMNSQILMCKGLKNMTFSYFIQEIIVSVEY
jgi:hypothetical protein